MAMIKKGFRILLFLGIGTYLVGLYKDFNYQKEIEAEREAFLKEH